MNFPYVDFNFSFRFFSFPWHPNLQHMRLKFATKSFLSFFYFWKNQSCEKGLKNRPVTKISKGDSFTPSGRPKKKIQTLKNLFPFLTKLFQTKFSLKNSLILFSWWYPHTSQRQLAFSSETDVILARELKIKRWCLFRQTLFIDLERIPFYIF